MKSQLLVIDLVGGWLPSTISDEYIHQQLGELTIAVVSIEPEYPGLEKINALIIWDRDEHLDTPRRVDLNATIHKLVKQFGKATNSTVLEIRHDRRETRVGFKCSDIKNVSNFEWIKENEISG